MKKLACILIVFLLCGCQVNADNIKQDITNQLDLMNDYDPITYTTMNKPLYSYYLPKDVGRISANDLSSLFIKDGVKFIMNFNPNRIVVHDYYRKDEEIMKMKTNINEESELFYEANGTFKGSDSRYHEYQCKIIALGDNNYLLSLDMSYVNYLAVLKPVQIESMIHSMFVMAKSVQYESKEVVAKYSLKSTSESIKTDLEEFHTDLPDNGSIADLIEKTEE